MFITHVLVHYFVRLVAGLPVRVPLTSSPKNGQITKNLIGGTVEDGNPKKLEELVQVRVDGNEQGGDYAIEIDFAKRTLRDVEVALLKEAIRLGNELKGTEVCEFQLFFNKKFKHMRGIFCLPIVWW